MKIIIVSILIIGLFVVPAFAQNRQVREDGIDQDNQNFPTGIKRASPRGSGGYDETGQYYPGVRGGIINPQTGEFMPAVKGGYIDPQTGRFIPAH